MTDRILTKWHAGEGEMSGSQYTAAPSMLGYIYQAQVALVELTRRSRQDPSTVVSLEIYDDVTFETGSEMELLQTKHHLNSSRDLSDTSTDLWRTLAVWMHNFSLSGSVIVRTLLTTQAAALGSAMSLLRGDANRNPTDAGRLLEAVASSSVSASNAPHYSAFLSMEANGRRSMLESIVVIDAAPDAASVEESLRAELRHAVRVDHLEAFVARLVEWWYRRIVHHLLSPDRSDRIAAEELDSQLAFLRDQFVLDNLPVDVFVEDDEEDSLSFDERMFVRQLQLIALDSPGVEVAIRDYKRAFLQRSRWLRDLLVEDSELQRFEARLVDEWQHYFTTIQLSDGSNEAALTSAGFQLYRDIQQLDLPIRPRVQEKFVARGTFHILADGLRVGWHPDFVARLQGVLEPASNSTLE